MNNMLLTTIEKAINTYLHSDHRSRKQLVKLAGKSVAVELLPLHLIFVCHFHPDSISVATNDTHEAGARIKGTPLQLFGMLLSKDRRQQFFADDVVMEGDAELAQQVMHLFEHIHIDWEEHAAKLIGDIPAHQLGRLVSRSREWLSTSSAGFCADVTDFLHEEAAWFPHREQLNEFFSDIDNIRMDTDRLEARLNHLMAQINKEGTS